MNFAENCLSDYAPRKHDEDRRREPIVSEPVAEDFRQIALEKVRRSAADGTLARHPKLVKAIFEWQQLSGQDNAEIRVWANAQLDNGDFVVALARQIPSESWSFGMGLDEMGDRVSRRTMRINLEPFSDLLDVARLDARVHELLENDELDAESRATLVTFRDTPRGGHRSNR